MLTQVNLFFDSDSHTYTDGTNNFISVTKLLSEYDEEFDADYWAMYRALEQNVSYKPIPYVSKKQVKIKYGGVDVLLNVNIFKEGHIPTYKTIEEIKEEWRKTGELAANDGTKDHAYIEDIINECSNVNAKYENAKFNSILVGNYKKINLPKLINSKLRETHEKILKLLVLYLRQGYTLLTEVRVYDSEYKIAGTIDGLLIKGKDVVLLDWKTNKEDIKFVAGSYKKEWNFCRTKKIRTSTFKKRSTKFKEPLNDLYSCKGNLYTLQLSTYAYILERWGFNIKDLMLVHIQPKVDVEDEIVYDEVGNREIEQINILKLTYLKSHVELLFNYYAKRV